jgi:hypothetical protein
MSGPCTGSATATRSGAAGAADATPGTRTVALKAAVTAMPAARPRPLVRVLVLVFVLVGRLNIVLLIFGGSVEPVRARKATNPLNEAPVDR